MPGNNLESTKSVTDSLQVGDVSHKLKVGGNDAIEVYEYPGLFAQRFDGIDPSGGARASDVSNIPPDGARTVGLL